MSGAVLTLEQLFARVNAAGDLPGASFLQRARAAREAGHELEARVGLGACLVLRIVEQPGCATGSAEERERHRWQRESVRKVLGDLPRDHGHASHLAGILEACAGGPPQPSQAVRSSLLAYAYFLEHEGWFAEALEMLVQACRTYGIAIPKLETPAIALFAGRLYRMLARWDDALRAYQGAEDVALALGDQRNLLLARLGRANVHRGRGDLPNARAEIERIVGAAGTEPLADVRARALQDLGAVLDRQGQVFGSISALYHAFECAQDDLTRYRVLSDLGVVLKDLGLYEPAGQAFTIVLASRASFVVRATAALELMDLESTLGNRVAFERRRQETAELADRMPAAMQVDYHYKVGVGLARFGQAARALRALDTALCLAEQHRLHHWYFRVERVRANLDGCADLEAEAPGVPEPELWELPAVAEVALGLSRHATLVLE